MTKSLPPELWAYIIALSSPDLKTLSLELSYISSAVRKATWDSVSFKASIIVQNMNLSNQDPKSVLYFFNLPDAENVSVLFLCTIIIHSMVFFRFWIFWLQSISDRNSAQSSLWLLLPDSVFNEWHIF